MHTLEAVYGQESSFGTGLGTRGSPDPAGHFRFSPDTAKEYGLSVSKDNDQRFDIHYASSAAARYLKDLDTSFSKDTLLRGSATIAVKNSSERYKFVLGAYNGGQTRVADAQHRAEKAGKDPRLWADVEQFLESKDTSASKADQMRQYVENTLRYQTEFTRISPASNHMKRKSTGKGTSRCTEGHWVTIDDRPVFICD